MSMSDPIADFLTRIRNGAKAGFKSVDIPGSNLKQEMARVLKSEGFIRNYSFSEDGKQGILRIYLKYDAQKRSAIVGLKRVSKPSRRLYLKCAELKPVLNGMGTAIVSTSQGVMADKHAKQHKIGGEVLCHVW